MNESYIRNAESAIQNDFKVFFGKKAEILDIVNSGRVVANKWYLAWDKGEIFVASPLKKLIPFGGSANNLSKEDIETLIKTATETELKDVRQQIIYFRDTITANANAYSRFESVVTKRVDKLDSDFANTIREKVNEALSSIESFVYIIKML